jgi:hypothetical protein
MNPNEAAKDLELEILDAIDLPEFDVLLQREYDGVQGEYDGG